MIVADNTMLIPAFITHERAEVVARLKSYDPDWIVPAVWRYEFTNVLNTQLRAKRINQAQASDALIASSQTVTPGEEIVGQQSALDIAQRFGISGYDAQYIVLAMAKQVPCVTDDRKLAERAAPYAILLNDFLSANNLR